MSQEISAPENVAAPVETQFRLVECIEEQMDAMNALVASL